MTSIETTNESRPASAPCSHQNIDYSIDTHEKYGERSETVRLTASCKDCQMPHDIDPKSIAVVNVEGVDRLSFKITPKG